ncbi:trihelix transcription factor ASR3-like [Pyrus communis]|uniref:trihelix transcription factor ASR3-like n=1 Tax=Pyrus communis TaxID=23211 RepID=UPI0035C0F69B
MVMASVQQVTLIPVDGDSNGVDARNPTSADTGVDDSSKAPRLPRWTRQEILVLINGKRYAEGRGGVRAPRSDFGSGQLEPKWAAVSNYCKKHGVNREPVQCRKRWSNLAGDFKKIREWEAQRKDETESYWVMRNDLRRERKLPGFFDKEVYDIMEAVPGTPVTLALPGPNRVESEEVKEEGTAEEAENLFDSIQRPTEEGLFSDDESGRSPEKEVRFKEGPGISAPLPISEKVYKPTPQGHQEPQAHQGQGAAGPKQPASIPEVGSTSQDRKRKRFAMEGDEEGSTLENQLIDVMERNGKMLADYLHAQNSHSQLDREQRKEHSDNLVAVLNKLADAFMRIAEKL